ncbi:MAG: redoxin domain-containing protein, partial [Thermoguttaceae bacterium]|nr:redoxin domain-containing protein [Thermoguttaceae bacterium]
MRVYEGVMVSNGAEMSAFANHVPNQVVKRPAPAQISIHTLFADEMLGGAISGAVSQAPTQSFSWVPIQLLLLLADDPLKTLLHKSDEPVLLEPAKIDEYECLRVELTRPDGKATLWIDRQSYLLRRLQFPVDEMLKQIPPEKKVSGLTLSADFVDARFQDQVDESAFRFEIPNNARVLETLMPPAMLLVGNPAPEFSFTGPDGKPIEPKSLRGKVVVLDFWATWCGPCRVKLPLVEKVYAKYKGHEKVAFVAVSVDRPETPDKDLQSVFSELNVTLPVARDPQQDAGKKFFVEAIPASCILGPDGVVQDFQAGFRPTHDTDLAAKIEKLLAGKSIQEQPLGQLQEERKLYAAWLDKWVKEGVFLPPSPDDQEVPKAEIAPRSDPKRFTLAPLWKCPDLKSPGNLMVVAEPAGSARLYVLDAWRTVAELGPDGKVAASHALDIPERQAATFLRTFGNGTKRWFLVSGAMQQQVHLFDEKWKKLVSFPEDAPENPHAGIADALLADLDGD